MGLLLFNWYTKTAICLNNDGNKFKLGLMEQFLKVFNACWSQEKRLISSVFSSKLKTWDTLNLFKSVTEDRITMWSLGLLSLNFSISPLGILFPSASITQMFLISCSINILGFLVFLCFLPYFFCVCSFISFTIDLIQDRAVHALEYTLASHYSMAI